MTPDVTETAGNFTGERLRFAKVLKGGVRAFCLGEESKRQCSVN